MLEPLFPGWNLDAPAGDADEVQPDDDTDLDRNSRGLYIGIGGDVVVVMASQPNSDQSRRFKNVPDGTILPIRVRRVLTDTTAEDILALV